MKTLAVAVLGKNLYAEDNRSLLVAAKFVENVKITVRLTRILCSLVRQLEGSLPT